VFPNKSKEDKGAVSHVPSTPQGAATNEPEAVTDDFEATFQLLSKVVRDGRNANGFLSAEDIQLASATFRKTEKSQPQGP
jgi:hypothetical protein